MTGVTNQLAAYTTAAATNQTPPYNAIEDPTEEADEMYVNTATVSTNSRELSSPESIETAGL